jgi:protein-disulfide isomerase
VKSPILLAALFAATPLFAVDVDPKLDRAVRDALPVCSGASVKYDALPVKLPARFTGVLVRVESASHDCDGQFAAVTSPTGGFFLGSPWPLDEAEGDTIEAKLQHFAWSKMGESMTATVERTRTPDGLLRATLEQTLEAGKMPLMGEVDPEGKVFFFGRFRPAGADVKEARTKLFAPFVANSPARGASKPTVTVVEFSDFQCPSCMRAAGFVDPIVARYGDKVRYVRVDLPLSGHAWAFPAALAGRAIHRQKPELFWEYKKQVYANQSTMNAFTFWDWARAFAEDHELDLAKYDADLQSKELRAEILKGAGTALSNEIRATPSYIVNGAIVEPGEEGKDLAAYVESLLK